jgi:hypothetical protein
VRVELVDPTALLEARAKPLSLVTDCQRAPSNDRKSPRSIDEMLFVGSSSQSRDMSDHHASPSLNPQPLQSWLYLLVTRLWRAHIRAAATLGIETKLSLRSYDNILCSTDFKHRSQQIENGHVSISKAR